MSRLSKRRKVSSDEEQPNVIQPAVVGSTSPTPEEVDIVPQLDVLPKIMTVDLQKDNADDVADALKLLKELLDSDSENPDDDNDEGMKNRREAAGLGMIGALVTTLKKWPESKAIQAFACECLACLAFLGDDEKVAVARLGGIEAALSAMKRFRGSLHVQNFSAWLLRNVLEAGSDQVKQPIQDAIKRFSEELDGIALVVKTMESFCNDLDLQDNGCELFRSISFSGKYRDALLKAGAASAVAKAAELHPDDEDIQEIIALFMSNMFPVKK